MSNITQDKEGLRLAQKVAKAIKAGRARANSPERPNTADICRQLGIELTNSAPNAGRPSVTLYPGRNDG